MTNSTTEPALSIRERLTHVALLQWRTPRTTPEDAIDAVLLEMLQPTEKMVKALHMSAHDLRQWKAGIQHIMGLGQ